MEVMMLSQYSKVWEKFFFFSGDKMCIVWKNYTSFYHYINLQILAHIFLANKTAIHMFLILSFHISKPNLQFLAVFEMWKLCIFWVYDFQSSSLKAAAADNEQKTCPGICHV